ncbi:MAG: hypothetical protein KAV87_03355 [Desulfobacteraceae bacterium]|nr:hypothetical protein [Desulfobacteraceae bacterium]
MNSKFDEYFETVLDFEADYLTLKDAWKAGGVAMLDYLTDLMDELGEAGYKSLKEEAEVFMGDKK